MSTTRLLMLARIPAAHCTRRLIHTQFTRLQRPPPQSFSWLQTRPISTPPPQYTFSNLSEERYHILSDKTMETMYENLDTWLDQRSEPGFDVEYQSGVLTLILGEHGTYVMNKQPPNKQIWLSSPVSGPFRYDYSEKEDDWLYKRDGRSMETLLETELKQATGDDVKLCLKGISQQVN